MKEDSFILEKTGDIATVLSLIASFEIKNEQTSEPKSQRELSYDCDSINTTQPKEEDQFEFLNSETRNKKNCEGTVRAVLQKSNIVASF